MARVIISDPILSKNTHNKITQSTSSWKYLFICLDMCMDMDMYPRFIHTASTRHQSTRPYTPRPLWTTTALLAQVCARQYNTSGRCHSSFRSCLESNVLPEGLSGRRTTSSTELLSASSGGFAAAASHSETSAPPGPSLIPSSRPVLHQDLRHRRRQRQQNYHRGRQKHLHRPPREPRCGARKTRLPQPISRCRYD